MHSIKLVFAIVALVIISAQVSAITPAAPPPLTTKDMISMSEVVFVGRVTKVLWREQQSSVKPRRATDVVLGDVRLETEVTDLLLGDSRRLKKRVIYLVGTSALSEQQASKKYEGKTFVFMGNVERLSRGAEPSIQVAFPPSGVEPLERNQLKEVMEEIGRKQGISGPYDNKAGETK